MTSTPTSSMPRATPLLVGTTVGIYAAFIVLAELARRDMSVTSAWVQLTSGAPLHFASASVLWAIAGIAFIGGAAGGALMVRFPPPWRGFRLVRWIIGAAIVFGLALIAGEIEPPHDVGNGTALVANMAAISVGALMALLGASFARMK
jgi:hypothetical protein